MLYSFYISVAIWSLVWRFEHTTSTYFNSYSFPGTTYSSFRTCGILHQLYVEYSVPGGSSDPLKTNPWVPVPLMTFESEFIHVCFGGYQSGSVPFAWFCGTCAFPRVQRNGNAGRASEV